MKYTMIAVALVLALSSSACANKPRERKQPLPNGKPERTDHIYVRPTPLNNGRPRVTVSGDEEPSRGGCRTDNCEGRHK